MAPGGKITKAALEAARFQEALKLVEEMFSKYAGAKPNVPQSVFPRAATGRQAVDPVIQRAIESKSVMDQMLAGMERGRPLAGWYNMEPTRLLWGDISGSPVTGTQRFNRFQDFMGPTSILSEVDPNIGNASRWSHYEATGQPPVESLVRIPDPNKPGKFKEKLDPPPPPGYGGAGQISQFKLANDMLTSGLPQDPLEYLKTARYGGALKGNTANLPVDRHAMRAPLMLLGDPEGLATSVKLGKDVPTFNAQTQFAGLEGTDISELPVTWWKDVPKNAAEYYAMEDYFKMLAREAGLEPAEGQAAAWVGHAPMTGVESDPSLTAQGLFNRRVANQAVKRDRDPRDILTDFMLGKGHL